ncbi:hypothetical protein COK65_18725 [Bacillus thuringiensis]|uniref:Uncharacterized protein n=1 Tax=Bacillus thuringiensis subsp. medellin TaxID=79672 RepID=A0A9X6RGX8_BACTV|nr:hypothetical protein [Bacillus thuringiensis]OUC01053.1 hypothetical protein BK784_13515 [Bacillus thuringiensis serovar medellin]PFS40794.1 hypothetical protein COK65_18725 [Bacillus thuringiensis]
MNIQYHYDGEVYMDREEFYKKIKSDYMIRSFFNKGKQFIYDGQLQKVLENNANVSNSAGWLYLQGETFSYYVLPQTLINNDLELREQWVQFLGEQDEETIDANLDKKMKLVISVQLSDEINNREERK